ncbi:MAG: hypothetical protein AB7O98_13305 [Hyphomonadaceae bacterium]
MSLRTKSWLTVASLVLVVLISSHGAFAQVDPQRIPPTAPVLQFAGRMPTGEGVFVETTTFGRWQGNGYGWLVLLTPSDPRPIWVREIVNCQTRVITDDYVVWMDERLTAFASSDAGFPNSSRTHAAEGLVETTFVTAACAGAPADVWQRVGNLQNAVAFARRLPE